MFAKALRIPGKKIKNKDRETLWKQVFKLERKEEKAS